MTRDEGVIGETAVIVSRRIFVSVPSPKLVSGYPLESLQIDPASGRYLSEMSQGEQDAFWQKTIGTELCDFVSKIALFTK